VSLEVDLDVEIEFLNQVSISTPKNYQIWSYRREIVSLRKRCEGEMEFLRKIFDIDKKNIHAWGYRQWLVRKFELWGEDKEYALELIKSDAYNNSAWNQLMFISKHDGTVDSLERKIEETKFVLEFCLEKENECPFNYLRGLYSKETQELIKQYFLEIIKVQGISKNLLKTLAYFSYIDKNREIQEVCYEKLQVLDIVRQLFWKWKSETCEGDSSSSDLDEAVLKMLKSI
jgi:protein farnesyltransferase/geranylgeranyltransferase type-1 subunit alpha